MIIREYKKLSEYQIGKIYHKWVKENFFILFTEWEAKIISKEISIKGIKV